HAHGVIVRQHDIFDRLVGNGAHPLDYFVRHRRGRLRVEHKAAVVADDDCRIRIALGGEGVEIGADLGEGDFLLRHISGGRKPFGHQFSPCCLSYCCCCCCCWLASSIRRLASAIASLSTAMSPIWLASTSTSAASRSALCASLKPRCASTMARKASSGFAKLELVDSVMTIPDQGRRHARAPH